MFPLNLSENEMNNIVDFLKTLTGSNVNELILDAKLDIVIKKSDEIYKSFLTPKNYRIEIKKIELSFNYNFDQKILELNDIKIDNKLNQKLNKSLKILMFKDDRLQNKIYFKNKINKAIKYYAG